MRLTRRSFVKTAAGAALACVAACYGVAVDVPLIQRPAWMAAILTYDDIDPVEMRRMMYQVIAIEKDAWKPPGMSFSHWVAANEDEGLSKFIDV